MRLVVTKRNSGVLNTRAGALQDQEIPVDTYRERLLKYTPVESLVFFVTIYGGLYAIMGTEQYFPLVARWILFLGIAITVLWLWKVEGVTDWIQLTISSAGFVVWMFALGIVPISDLPWYNQVISALFLPVYVFGTPLIEGIPHRW